MYDNPLSLLCKTVFQDCVYLGVTSSTPPFSENAKTYSYFSPNFVHSSKDDLMILDMPAWNLYEPIFPVRELRSIHG
jgi:hypothetical protein